MRRWPYILKLTALPVFWLLIGSVLMGAAFPAAIAQTAPEPSSAQNRQREAAQLFELGQQQYVQGQFARALNTFQQTLALYRTLGDRQQEGRTLTALGLIHHSLSQYPQALEVLQSALQIAQALPDQQGEGQALNELGTVHRKLGKYNEAMKWHEQALVASRQAGDRLTEGRILNELGVVYGELGQYAKGLDVQQQALTLTQESRDRLGEGRVLNSIGVLYGNQGDYAKAQDYYQQALRIRRDIGDLAGEARTINNLGAAQDALGQYTQARTYYQQALRIRRDIGDREGESVSLGNIGLTYVSQGQYPKAQEYYQQALTIATQIGDRAGEGYLLSSLGTVASYLNNYVQALEYYQQALTIQRQMGARAYEGHTLNSIGAVYDSIGQYPKALEFYQQALAVQREIGDRFGEARSLSNLGGIYDSLKQYTQALASYQQALTLRRALGDRAGEGATLNNLGLVYSVLGQYDQALPMYEQALAIHQQTGDQGQQGTVLNNIGALYERQQQQDEALKYYQRALSILRSIGERAGERLTLSNIATIWAQKNQPELAIAFYKQSVNITESIRQDLRQLSKSEQEIYTNTVANTYRALADLLLSQKRILEAQQVLELLKVQELREFTRDAKVSTQASGVRLNPAEEKLLDQHQSLIALGQEIDRCKRDRCAQLSQLNDRLQTITQRYNQVIATYEEEIRQRRAADDAFLDPTKVPKLREIVEAQPGTVLIYPLVLKDKIWLVWAAKGGIINGVQVDVSDRQLGETVLQFRQGLAAPFIRLKQTQASGKALYDWLIKPLEPELKSNNIQHLVFALDRVTRYIPMSALFDGKQYLIENYTVSTVLSADLTNVRDRLPAGTQNTAVLAVGASQFNNLNPLPNVPSELDGIVRKDATDTTGIYPGLKFLNQDFNFRSLRDNLFGHRILHIATHGAFIPGRPEDSYLVLGNSEKLTIPQIKTLPDLNEVHLVVLSACETALGGPDQDGTEISGISYYFLNSGAAAVLASLWAVDDSSTSELMQQFYAHLAAGTEQAPVSKAEALRQAQLSLLTGKTTANVAIRGSNNTDTDRQATTPTRSPYAHPYYWAPFVLIGNGL